MVNGVAFSAVLLDDFLTLPELYGDRNENLRPMSLLTTCLLVILELSPAAKSWLTGMNSRW